MTEYSHFGFTGTRHGLAAPQKLTLHNLLRFWTAQNFWKTHPAALHHGDCVGADQEANDLARMLGWRIHLHPGTEVGAAMRANCLGDWEEPVKPYLARNRDIVKASTFMFACTASMTEEVRSGTWATVRYAKELGKHLTLILPNGSSQIFRGRRAVVAWPDATQEPLL